MAVGGALFGGGSTRTQSKALVEFRAGKMTYSTSTKMVSPDKRKGLVSVYQSEGDHLMHFTWKDRGSGSVEDDLIIFPDDCEFISVPACTTGRVFLLKFKTSNKRMFFWMQEPKAEKDEELCKKVNDSLNNPPAPGSNRSSGGTGGGLPGGIDFNNLGDSELQNLLNNMSQQQLMQLFGGSLGGAGGNSPALASLLGSAGGLTSRSRQAAGGGRHRPLSITSTPQSGNSSSSASATPSTGTSSESSTTTTTTTTSTSSSTATTAATTGAGAPTPATPANSSEAVAAVRGAATAAPGKANSNAAIQLSDLQSILSNIQVPPGAEGISAGGGNVDLATSMNAEALQPLLTSPGFLEKVKDFLPKGEGDNKADFTAEDLKGTVQSPQFQQAVTMFSMALQSGQLAPLVREFGLGESAVTAASQGDMLAFVKALQKDGDGDKKKDEETPME